MLRYVMFVCMYDAIASLSQSQLVLLLLVVIVIVIVIVFVFVIVAIAVVLLLVVYINVYMFVYRFVCVYKYCLLSQLVAVFFFLFLLWLLLLFLFLSFSFILLEEYVFTLSIFLLDEGNQKRIVINNRKLFLLHFVSYLYIYCYCCCCWKSNQRFYLFFFFFAETCTFFLYILFYHFLDSEVCVEFRFWFLNLVVGFGIGILRFEICFNVRFAAIPPKLIIVVCQSLRFLVQFISKDI